MRSGRHLPLPSKFPTQRQTENAARAIRTQFTARQRAVLAWVSVDASNQEIAKHLNVGIKTIEGDLTAIYRHLNVRGHLPAAVLWVTGQSGSGIVF